MFERIFKLLNNFSYVSSDIQVNDKDFIHNIKFSIQKEKVLTLKNYLIGMLSKNIKIYYGDYPIEEFNETSDEEDLSVTLTQDLIPEGNQKLYFFSYEDFLDFESKFIKQERFMNFANRKSKIRIDIYRKIMREISTPIFSTKEENLEIPEILCEKSEFNKAKICALPSLISIRNYGICKDSSLENFLFLVSERKISNNEFIISFQKNAVFKIKNENEDENITTSLNFFDTLNEIFLFIFEDSQTYYEKLVIFRNIFSDYVIHKNKLQRDDFRTILKEMKSNYNLFIEDKLKKYISDKQKLIEDFTRLRRDILNSIKNISNTMLQQLLVLITTLLTTFIFKSLNSHLAICLTVFTGIFYLICIFAMNDLRGWDLESSSIEAEFKQIENMYNIIYKAEQSYFDSLKNDLSYDKEIEKLKKVENIYKRIVFILFIILFIAFLILLFHSFLYTNCEFYKQIVDFFTP